MSKSFISFQDKTMTWGNFTYDISGVYSPTGDQSTPFARAVSAVSNYETYSTSLEGSLRGLARAAEKDIERLESGHQLYGINANAVVGIAQTEQKLKDIAEQVNNLLCMVPEAELDRLRLS